MTTLKVMQKKSWFTTLKKGDFVIKVNAAGHRFPGRVTDSLGYPRKGWIWVIGSSTPYSKQDGTAIPYPPRPYKFVGIIVAIEQPTEQELTEESLRQEENRRIECLSRMLYRYFNDLRFGECYVPPSADLMDIAKLLKLNTDIEELN